MANRVEAGGAVAGDRDAVHRLRQLLREEDDDAAEVEGLQALGHAHAAEDLLDRGGIDGLVALEDLVDHVGPHLVGA
jgi:hypothetical protein